MKNYLIILLLILPFLYSQQKEVITDRYLSGVKKTITIYDGEGTNEKLIRKLGYWDNGEIQFSTEWNNGKRNGNVNIHYVSGELGFDGKFVNDTLNGEIKIYLKDGKTLVKGKMGRKKISITQIPLWVRVIKDENDKEEMINMLSNKPYLGKIGIWKTYDKNGELIEQKTYTNEYDETDFMLFYYKDEKQIVELLKDLTDVDFDYQTLVKRVNDLTPTPQTE